MKSGKIERERERERKREREKKRETSPIGEKAWHRCFDLFFLSYIFSCS